MADLNITVSPELLRGRATELRGYKGQHDEAMAKIRTLVLGLNEIWGGEAQKAFVAQYEGMQSTFTNFSELLENYSKSMETVAQQMEGTDIKLSQDINNSFGG